MSIDFGRWDRDALRAAWQAAEPFPHIVIDGVLGDAARSILKDALDREPHERQEDEIYSFLGSALPPTRPEILAFRAALDGDEAHAIIETITGKRYARVHLRSYIYLAGDYLLPHLDNGSGTGRVLAFAYYVARVPPIAGGELELFACRLDERGDIAEVNGNRLIDAVDDRLVIFDVSFSSLHQVREVLGGPRLSLAGWLIE